LRTSGTGGGWGLTSPQPPSFAVREQGLIGWAAASGESLSAPEVRNDPRYVPLADSDETCSELVVPLRAGSLVLVVLGNLGADILYAYLDPRVRYS